MDQGPPARRAGEPSPDRGPLRRVPLPLDRVCGELAHRLTEQWGAVWVRELLAVDLGSDWWLTAHGVATSRTDQILQVDMLDHLDITLPGHMAAGRGARRPGGFRVARGTWQR